MFGDQKGVLDRLSESTQLQTLHVSLPAFFRDSAVSEKIAKLDRLRGIFCSGDWSGVTGIRSLRTLVLKDCQYRPRLLDNSPLFNSSSMYKEDQLQEWKRCDSESPFYLTKLSISGRQSYESLSSEVDLEDLKVPLNTALLDVLPRCKSLRSLHLTRVSSDEQILSLSEALLLAPFLHSLSLEGTGRDLVLSSLPLGALHSARFSGSFTLASVSEVITTSKPKSLTSLELGFFTGSVEPLTRALLACPSLTRLILANSGTDDILPVVQILNRLPLVELTLELTKYSDESIECLLSFLSQSAVQDLKLGTLSPNQHQLLADALPSISSLQTLQLDTQGFGPSQHDSSHLALFSALRSSSLRSLTLRSCSFYLATFDSCLNKIPGTRLTEVILEGLRVHDTRQRMNLDKIVLEWNSRFPRIKDRFCLLVATKPSGDRKEDHLSSVFSSLLQCPFARSR
jgi:hypothetical protein